MTIQDTCLHHKHTREREQLGPNNKSAVTPSEPVEPLSLIHISEPTRPY